VSLIHDATDETAVYSVCA